MMEAIFHLLEYRIILLYKENIDQSRYSNRKYVTILNLKLLIVYKNKND